MIKIFCRNSSSKDRQKVFGEKEMNASGIKILSIGRFCYAKNFDNVPDICRQIRQNGLEVTWYLIGFGKK